MPSAEIRAEIQRRLQETGIGARQLEDLVGLKPWSLRGILDASRPQVPSVDRAAEICAAIGLEFYVGPPRPQFKGVVGELGVEYVLWRHMLWHLRGAIVAAEALEVDDQMLPARATAAGFIASVLAALVRAQDVIDEPVGSG